MHRVQPVQATQDKQKALWRDLILQYCRQQRVFQLSTDADDDCPLFNNPVINRTSHVYPVCIDTHTP